MEKKPPRAMTPFDEHTIPNELHTLKLFLPYTPAALQQSLGILIRVMELQSTVRYFQHTESLSENPSSAASSSPIDMLEEISPYLAPEMSDMLDTFRNMMNIMNMVQMMQEFSDPPDSENHSEDGQGAFSSASTGKFDPGDLLMGMLSPEQKELFETYQTAFTLSNEPPASESPDPSSKMQDTDFTDASSDKIQNADFTDTFPDETQDIGFTDTFPDETQDIGFTDTFPDETQDMDFTEEPLS